jgi:glucosylceramidase
MKAEADRTRPNKGFIGLGVAITGSSCYNLWQMDKDGRHALLQSIYGKDGLGLSIGRLTVGSSDYSAELYSYDDVEGDVELKHFSVQRDEAYIIPMIQEILKINPDLYLFASPWSPPGWMKTGGSIGGGYMRREFIDCYAEYIVRFILEYAKHGIRISALTPQNEVETDQKGKMPACRWHPDIEAEFVITLRKKLDNAGLDTKIWLHDHNFDGYNRIKWMLNTHKQLSSSCDGLAFHYYSGVIEDTLPLQAEYPNLPMHFTEGGPRLYDRYDSDWCKWGIMMSKVLNCGYQSFTGWNLMLDQLGGPNIGPFFCGGLITRNRPTGELTYSGQYKAFSHFASFIKRNATVYHIEQEQTHLEMFKFPSEKEIPLQVSCVENTDGSLCYFLINANKQKEQVQILENGQWYYVELLPDTVCTVVFEK